MLSARDERRALKTVDEIALALVQGSTSPGSRHSLANGVAGLTLFYHYLARAQPGRGYEAAVERLRRQCLQLLVDVRMDASLYDGFSGVLWTLAHVSGETRAEGPSASREIDCAIREYLGTSPWRRPYDLVAGLAGHGVYALERLPDPVAADCLERVVERLDELAERSESGTSWLTPVRHVPEAQRVHAPNGYRNLGVAHGVPGALAVLAAAAGAGIAVERSRDLAEGAVRWLLAQSPPPGNGPRFAYWVAPNQAPAPSRSAWCYGDPGVAAALLTAARCAGKKDWEREAVAIGMLAARREPGQTGVKDAGLCHGAAGLGHIFNRLYQATGEAELGRAARDWLGRTLALRRPGEGVAGFAPHRARGDQATMARGFLTGAAGIGLALLAAVSDVEPAWDRLMLLSVRPETSSGS